MAGMPRLHGYYQKTPHDFAWQVDLEPGKRQGLFKAGQELAPGQSICDDHGALFEHTVIILDVAVDRADIELSFVVGNQPKVTLCGPWLRGHMLEVYKVMMDCHIEKRTADEKKLWGEVSKLAAGLLQPIVVPVRMPLAVYAKLLAHRTGGPPITTVIQLRTIIRQEIQ